MNKEIVSAWEQSKDEIEKDIRYSIDNNDNLFDYNILLKFALNHINEKLTRWDEMDVDNIHIIDDGDYQGTFLFIIPEKCYQPHTYWVTKVGYGSCSACDTMLGIESAYRWGDISVNQVVQDLMTVVLHMVQQMEEI